jgi:hypothetical protein
VTEEIQISFLEFMHSPQFDEFYNESMTQEQIAKVAGHFADWDDERISAALVKTIRELLRRQGPDKSSLFTESNEELLGLAYALSSVLKARA